MRETTASSANTDGRTPPDAYDPADIDRWSERSTASACRRLECVESPGEEEAEGHDKQRRDRCGDRGGARDRPARDPGHCGRAPVTARGRDAGRGCAVSA